MNRKVILFSNSEYLEQRCPTFLAIGQIFDAKSLGEQVLDLKFFFSGITSYNNIKRAFSIQNNFLKKCCGHSKNPWRAKKCFRLNTC